MLLSRFIIERLNNAGVNHVFGLPGDYVLDFYKELWDSKIKVINCTDENHAGFAADAYARVRGVGCVCVTYNVGALKVANAVACAYAERSPLIVLSGAPGIKERRRRYAPSSHGGPILILNTRCSRKLHVLVLLLTMFLQQHIRLIMRLRK